MMLLKFEKKKTIYQSLSFGEIDFMYIFFIFMLVMWYILMVSV